MSPRRRFHALGTVVFISWKQLWDRKALNSIAVGGVTLGVFVLIVMSGILNGFHQKFTEAILAISPHVVVFDTELHPASSMLESWARHPVVAHIVHQGPSDRQARMRRPNELARSLRRMSGVTGAAPSIAGTVLVEFGGKTRSIDLRGIDVVEQERVTSIAPFIVSGSLSALRTDSSGVVLGDGLAQLLGVRLNDVIHASAERGARLDLRVVGIYESGVPSIDKNRGYTQVRTGQVLLGKQDVINRIEVRLEDPNLAPRFASSMERLFEYDAESWQETNANFLSTFKMQDTIVGFVIGALLLVGGFGILSVQIMMVLQKQRDIAVMRSIGLRRFDILRIFLLQGFVVAFTGGLCGDVLGKLGQHFLGKLKVHMEGGAIKTDTFLVAEDPHFYLYGIGFALLVGMTAALIPAWRASKVEPVDVLRGLTG
jgi:lipoprotein-releasing system permease protein